VRLRYAEQQKYLRIMWDLNYIAEQDRYDLMLQESTELLNLDEAFRESYIDIVKRFYNMFESIYKYFQMLQVFLSDVNEGKYIEFTLEAILSEKEGKRLIIEALYNYGAMLLLLDRLIPSIARERIVTCYIRYSNFGSSDQSNSTAVAKLIKSTGYFYNKAMNTETIPEQYPAKYFSRFKLDPRLVESLLNSMKDDDIYDKLAVYGNNPLHRSLALAN
jgi:WASH complex subunit strumpellin